MATSERGRGAADSAGWGDATQAMYRAAQAASHPGGPSLFTDLVRELAEVLQSAAVFIAVFSDESRLQMHTLAVLLDGALLESIDYPLAGSPCEKVVGRAFRYVASGLAGEFPQGAIFAAKGMDSYAAYPLNDSSGTPLGLLAAMDRRPVADAALAEALLKIFAGRIAAEIERSRADEALRVAALAVSSGHGESVFSDLVRYLATLLHVDVAFIALHEAGAPLDMRMMAMVRNGQLVPHGRYALDASPCARVLGHGFRAFPTGLRELFPDDRNAAVLGMDSFAGFPLIDPQGQSLGTVGVASRQPLTNLKRIESMLQIFAVRAGAELEQLHAHEALRRSEASYRAIFESAEDAIFVHDWDTGEVLDVNRKACEAYGYSHDELKRIALADIGSETTPFTAEQTRARIQLAKLGRCPPFEWQRRNKDGSLHWDEVRLKPAQIDGKPHILAFTREITEYKAALAAAQAREEQYKAVFEGSADALAIWSRDLRIIEINRAFTRTYGFEREDVIGTVLDQRIEPGARAKRAQLIRAALEGHEGLLEAEAMRKDGSRFEVELRYLPIAYAGEAHVLAVGRDLSARRAAESQRAQLEAQLRQAQKMEAIGQLTGGIAHDFNNILTSIMGYLVLGQERALQLADAALVRQLGSAQQASQRARDLVAQMLAFARRQQGERRRVALDQIVQQSLQLLRSVLPTSVTVDAAPSVDDGALHVDADPVQLEQVLLNLCINARDAIAEHGWIRVRLQPAAGGWHCVSCRKQVGHGPWAALSVADSGSGVAPEIMERLFEPFFTTKEVGHGSGMGLAIVHGIVHEHGGHIDVQTRAGVGTEFRVLLPLAGPAAVAPPAAGVPLGTTASIARLSGRVMVVEDDPMVGEFMAELLGGWGLEVLLLPDPLVAATWIEDRDNALDLLITDQTMPGLNGLELSQRASAARPGLPVLLYTGNADVADAAETRARGVRAVLRKPLEPDMLRALLQRWITVPSA
jgi:PAS domain S-box-containing protein